MHAQNKILLVQGIDKLKITYPRIVKDSSQASTIVSDILEELNRLSYLTASVNKHSNSEDSIVYSIEKGSSYKWVTLKSDLDDEIVNAIDFNGKLFTNRPFSKKQLQKLYTSTINHFEQNGYPFAQVQLDSIEISQENSISAKLVVKKNKFYSIDSIIIKGYSEVGRAYILKQLSIQEGSPYNQLKIDNIDNRIQEVPFLESTKKKQVQFFDDYVKVILNLKKKKASRFDGILGLLTEENSGRIELTGDVDLNLINSFNKGEIIDLNWRKLQGNNQDLQLGFEYPYIFKSQIGIDYDFILYKRDTTFLDLNNRFGVNYILNRGEVVTLFLENKASNLLSREAIVNSSNDQLPSLGDVSINSFGVNYKVDRSDYRFNPRKGLLFSGSFSAGRKRLTKIAALEEENPSIYDGVDLNSNQFNGNVQVAYHIPVKNRSTVKVAAQAAAINSERIFENELLRIGGLKVLRGFDEESIRVSSYSVFTLEYRYLLDKNSFFSVFTDAALYESKSVNNPVINDNPFGVGAGVSFETNAGIFTFNYAIGQQLNNPFQFRAAKIHFGFVNFF